MVALVAGKTERAISELSEATELAPENAAVWSDLAAAHLQRGAELSDPYELTLALAAANRAVQRDPVLPTARFNRAVVLGRLSLRREADRDWQIFLSRERNPHWSREARARAAVLRQIPRAPDWETSRRSLEQAVDQGATDRVRALVADSPQAFREYLEEDLLLAWARTENTRRQPDTSRQLAISRAIADSLVKVNGERMAADTISQIDHLRSAAPKRFQKLVQGLLAYGEGLSLLRTSDFSRAQLRFQTARKLLMEEDSPFTRWAVFRVALCEYQRSNYGQARILLNTLERDLERERYRALHGRTLRFLGLIEAIEGNPTASLTAYESALADFQVLREKAHVARMISLLAGELAFLGKRAEAWRRLYPALIDPSLYGTPEVRSYVCEIASAMAREQEEIEIALWFQDEVLRNAQITGTSYAVAEALRWRAADLARLGRSHQAAENLAKARGLLASIPDPEARRALEVDILLAESEFASNSSPQHAIASLDKVIQTFRATSYHYLLGRALFQRAIAADSLGRSDDAERDLHAAIAEFERQREKIVSSEERISYFDHRREIFDAMISFQLERRRQPEVALRFSEQAKARVLWDWVLTQPAGGPAQNQLDRILTPPVDVEVLQQDLLEGAAVIEYAVLPESTILWILRRGEKPEVRIVGAGANMLGERVQKLHRALLEGQTVASQKISAELYDTLIRPAVPLLVTGERLVLIPDGPLHALPFALLRDRQTLRYLVQDYACSVAPSLRVFEASLRRDEALARRSSLRALVIVDPDFDRNLYAGLPRLKAADTEASIAKILPGSQVLRDRSATRRAFLQSAGNFEIVHFGGHSVVNMDIPLLSQMLFSKEAEDPARGVLYSGDILGRRFERTRLVVLASCGTAIGRISRTEGVENLARPFLAAGVPAVVASLWDVDDEVTADFFIRFYRYLKQGSDVAEALRATQVDFIERGSGLYANPKSWGGFEMIGGSLFKAERIN